MASQPKRLNKSLMKTIANANAGYFALAAFTLVLLWAIVVRQVAVEWSVNPQYAYAWSVPFLSLFLLVREWRSRPPPRPPTDVTYLAIAALILISCLLPVRIIAESNPDWRMTSWALALIVAGIGLMGTTMIGGLPWLRHFALIICLPLTAVPWPVQFEQWLVQSLMRLVAAVTVEVVNVFGIAAVREGNLIRVANGVVGIDEACSGIRSLQATLMIALTLGQLFRLSLARRFWLIVAGSAIAFLTNVTRTTILVSIGATHGIPTLAAWHDPAGFTVTAVCLLALLGIALLFARAGFPRRREIRMENTGNRLRVVPPAALVALCGWVFAVEAATEFWYRAHERQFVERPAWQIHWPNNNETLKVTPIAETTRAMLRYNWATSATWEDPGGIKWWSFFARWEPRRSALHLVRSHSPEICLPAIGRTFKRELPPVAFDDGVIDLSFRAYEFQQQQRPLFVFVCIQENKVNSDRNGESFEWNTRGRLLAAWHGRRNLGQRLLEIAVNGLDDFSQARDAVKTTVRAIVTD